MENFVVPKEHWSAHLVPVLSTGARRAYSALSRVTKRDFNRVKEALLKHYHVTRDTYRRKLDEARKQTDESWVMCGKRLIQWTNRWTAECTTREEVVELVAMEAALKLMPLYLSAWVRDRKPKTLTEATEMADKHLHNTGYHQQKTHGKESWRHHHYQTEERGSNDNSSSNGKRDQTGHEKSRHDAAQSSEKPRTRYDRMKFDPVKGLRCFHCNEFGHMAAACPKKMQQVNLVEAGGIPAEVLSGRVEEETVTRMLVDTGASRTIVHSKWVPAAALTKMNVEFQPFHGPPCTLPLAGVTIEVAGHNLDLDIAVQDDLLYDAILGRDVPSCGI